jgi:Peptidase family M23
MKVKLNGNDFYEVTCPFGSTDPLHPNGHRGLDLSMVEGTELYSPVDGVVKKIVDYGSENLGKGIFIETDDHKTVIMGHLSDFKVSEGVRVSEGDLVALSGNTGRSTGGHLHLGLKDESGGFVNPEPLLNDSGRTLNDVIFQKEGILSKMSNTNSNEVGFIEGAKSFGEFLQKWNNEGSFWIAMYDKPFSQVMGEFFSELGRDIGVFILGNSDVFFLLPAIAFMLGTFIVGKNKFTKWIVPLWFGYFVATFFHKMLL